MKTRPVCTGQTESADVKIRILATTDLHMNLTGFDYYTDLPDVSVGLTRTANLINSARHSAGDAVVLLFDNGDALQGTPLGDQAVQDHDTHPMMQGFAALQYDAIGLGNHDFGFGLDALDQILADAPCPVLCSNLHPTKGIQTRWQDHAIFDRTVSWNGQDIPLRIGVFSVLPPQTTQWEAHHLNGMVAAEGILDAAKRAVQSLKSAGCDLIIALAHSGIEQEDEAPGSENTVIALAALAGIDALIAGHTHFTLPGPSHSNMPQVDHDAGLIHGKPVVMAGSAGSHLGQIDLHIAHSDDAGWAISAQSAKLHAVSTASDDTEVPENPELVTLFAPIHSKTRAEMAEPATRISQPLHSYFSFCAPDQGLALVAMAQAAGLRPYLAGSALADLPMLSAVSPYKCGGRAGPRFYTDVPAGEVCLRHIADLHIFPNELRAVRVTGAQVLDWLEMSAGVFHQLQFDAASELIDPSRAGYNFDVLFGLSYQIDLSQPARFDRQGQLLGQDNRRIRQLRINGSDLRPEQEVIVALNNYRASGGGYFPFVDQAQAINLPPLDIKRVLRDYLIGDLPADPLAQTPYPFALAPQDGAQAILTTGPGALKYLAELNIFEPQVLTPDPLGFERIQLTL